MSCSLCASYFLPSRMNNKGGSGVVGAVWRRKEVTQLFPVGWTDKRTMNCLSAPPLHTHTHAYISISLACLSPLSLDYFLLITIFGGSLHFVARREGVSLHNSVWSSL